MSGMLYVVLIVSILAVDDCEIGNQAVAGNRPQWTWQRQTGRNDPGVHEAMTRIHASGEDADTIERLTEEMALLRISPTGSLGCYWYY